MFFAVCFGREMKWCVVWSSMLLVLLSWFRSEASAPFKPVIIVHGLFDGPDQFKDLEGFIKQAHNGTYVKILSDWSNLQSLRNLWTQVDSFKSALMAELSQAPDGAHLICFSQGGLICRALLSMIPNHNISTFIALASPLAGQYGETDYLKNIPHIPVKEVHTLCYGIFDPWHLSICEYWNDPCHHDEYLNHNNFLAPLNGEKPNDLDPDAKWRDNFIKIKNLVMIGGRDDGVITPWQSSHFAFYTCNGNVVEMKEMKNQEFYTSDTFGLKTLDFQGKLHVYEVDGVHHTQWHHNHSVFTKYISDYLD